MGYSNKRKQVQRTFMANNHTIDTYTSINKYFYTTNTKKNQFANITTSKFYFK